VPEAPHTRPSANRFDDWLYAAGPVLPAPALEPFGGKWLIFAPRSRVDALWSTVKVATEQGCLGFAAKVSTALPGGYAPGRHVICVYTADFRNRSDVARVLAGLRAAGVSGRLYYKTDVATSQGLYAAAGPFTQEKGKASLYCSDEFEAANRVRSATA